MKQKFENQSYFNYIIKPFLLLVLFILFNNSIYANKINITDVSIIGGSTVQKYNFVQFSISWENSWRTTTGPQNWDAAWLFVKFRVKCPGGNGEYVSSQGATSSSTTITVGSTVGLRVGMPVKVTAGNGVITPGTVVTAINSATTFTISAAPTTALTGSANVVTGYTFWEHAKLNPTGFTAPTGSTITPSNDSLGAFLYRSEAGTGTFSVVNAQLRWNYGSNSVANNDIVDIQVFGIEMVYVPQGAFSLGSGGSEVDAFYKYPTKTNPYSVTSETGSITIGTSNNNLYYSASSSGGDQTGTLSSSFPKGYDAFYCMKYEIMQQGYVDFLNTLTYKQQETRTTNSPSSSSGTAALVTGNLYRNGIDIKTPGVNPSTPAVYACNLNGNTTFSEPDDGQNIACNYIGWTDLSAYFDWSGLRPMTELEFEKACRGTQTPVPNEYAWGTTNINTLTYSISNSACANEVISANYGTTIGNAIVSNNSSTIYAPLRVGIFSGTSGNTGRVTSGATFYGIMEMTGNLWERPVMTGNANGRTFTGLNGDGKLDRTGNSDVTNWPSPTIGAGFRGGAFQQDATYARTSDRRDASLTFLTRDKDDGGRGVRKAP
jgi:formylglycine-generating enzyme required for sulfatase activity